MNPSFFFGWNNAHRDPFPDFLLLPEIFLSKKQAESSTPVGAFLEELIEIQAQITFPSDSNVSRKDCPSATQVDEGLWVGHVQASLLMHRW